MHWFEGGISEAVGSAKAKNAVFVVFVEGSDTASQNVAATINSAEVSSMLESNDFVAIKLASGSQLYTQFAQIYQIVPVPSIFFIGGSGVPMEVVADQISVPDLVVRIDNVLQKHRQTKTVGPAFPASQPVLPQPQTQPEPSAPAAEERTTEEVCSVQEASPSSNTSSGGDNAAQVVCSDGLCERVPSQDKGEGIEKAKELLEKKRAQKQKEEEEKEREKELERRKVGQDVQKLRRWQQEQEMKRLLEERQREKAEADAARDRVRKQIEEDKAERAARFSAVNKQEVEMRAKSSRQPEQIQAHQVQSDVARIQFRLPDGTTNSHQFAARSTLAEVRRYVISNVSLPCRGFTLSTTFPRRDLTPSDDGTTLQDLQLTPTAVILVVPAGGVVKSSSPATSLDMTIMKRFMWTLIAPVLSIITYVRGLLFGGGNTDSSTQPADGSQAQPRPSTSQQNLRRRNARESTIRKEGNVHRLSNQDSSDDENNTWNGNSTQQM